MSEIKISSEVRHNIFRMPVEYFLLPEMQKQFDMFHTLDMDDPDMQCYVGIFNSVDFMGTPVIISIFSSHFKKETNG